METALTIAKINAPNLVTIGVIQLSDLRDVVTIILGAISIVVTILTYVRTIGKK